MEHSPRLSGFRFPDSRHGVPVRGSLQAGGSAWVAGQGARSRPPMPGCGALGTMEGFRAAGEGRGQTRVGSASGLWWGGMEAYCGLDSQGPWNVSAAPELLPCFRFCSFCKAFLECPDGSSPPHSRATFSSSVGYTDPRPSPCCLPSLLPFPVSDWGTPGRCSSSFLRLEMLYQ